MVVLMQKEEIHKHMTSLPVVTLADLALSEPAV
jgi:hypothetical protein